MITSPTPIAVLQSSHCLQRCQQLSEHLSLPLVDLANSAVYSYLLVYTEQGLAIQQTGAKAAGPVLVDFEAGTADHRRKFGGGELISKAVGGDKKNRPTVLDTTAGLGRDSFVLATANYSVIMCERSPVVAAVLADGIARAQQSDNVDLQAVVARMQLQKIDALSYMQNDNAGNPPDVIVIDPMFPESKKTALVKKEMRTFHDVVGADSDSDDLLVNALRVAKHRVVVKRPRKAQCLANIQPNFCVEGKAIRFDIYSLKAFGK